MQRPKPIEACNVEPYVREAEVRCRVRLEGEIAEGAERDDLAEDRLVVGSRHEHTGPGQFGARLWPADGQPLSGRRIARAIVKSPNRLNFRRAQAIRAFLSAGVATQ